MVLLAAAAVFLVLLAAAVFLVLLAAAAVFLVLLAVFLLEMEAMIAEKKNKKNSRKKGTGRSLS
jgi:hypothetical protein